MKVLTSAKSHGEETVKVPKDIIISFSNKTFNVSKYLKPDREKEGNLRFLVAIATLLLSGSVCMYVCQDLLKNTSVSQFQFQF